MYQVAWINYKRKSLSLVETFTLRLRQSEWKAEGKLKTTSTDRETRGGGRSDGSSGIDRSSSFCLINGPCVAFPPLCKHLFIMFAHHTHINKYYVAEQETSRSAWRRCRCEPRSTGTTIWKVINGSANCFTWHTVLREAGMLRLVT